MKYINLEQRTPEWRRWRQCGITATDSAVILGMSPYKSRKRLWAEKVGRIEPADLSKNPFVQYGVAHEDDARRLFELAHDICVMPACAEYDGNPIFRASFDGLTPDDEPVEIKCPGDTVLDEVKREGLESRTCRLYAVQVQHQMLVSGAKRGWLVFFDHGRILEFEIERDEAIIERILDEGKAFHSLITQGRPPECDPKKDSFVPTPDEAQRWMQAAHRWRGLEAQIEALDRRLADLKSSQLKVRDELAAMMGEFDRADFGGIALTRSMTRGKSDLAAVFRDVTGREPTDEELDRRRSPAGVRWLVRTSERFAPDDCFESESIAAAAAAEPEIDGRI